MKCIAKITDKNIGEKIYTTNNPSTRTAVRAILLNSENKIALLHKVVKNEYKLIGGGLEDNESLEQALEREVLEETGCTMQIISELGYVIEYRTKDNFIQTSYIYVCRVSSNTRVLHLTKEELDECAELCWFKPEIALKKISKSYTNLIPSKYSNIYSSKMLIKRDETILKYYIDNN